MSLDEKIESLPVPAQIEIHDFVEFIQQKYAHRSEEAGWLLASKESLNTIWNNDEDDVYNELLNR